MGFLSEIKQRLGAGEPAAMRSRSVQCIGPHGLHRMAYVEWGDARNPRVLVCVHGLTRCGRDFDFLARALARDYRVVCPDVVGRGRSDWLPVADDYGLAIYTADMITLIARLDVESVDWVGTSMGGLIGMALALQKSSPVRRLVLNDVGPVITATSLQRISEYLGKAPRFASIDEAESYIRAISASFGALSDAQWRHLAEHSTRRTEKGGIEMAYDPAIAEPFRKAMLLGKDIDLWPMYDAIRCPTLVMRGAQSDLLLHDTAVAMAGRGPRARLAEVPGVGHAPMLMDEAQIGIVREFLLNA
jgi:pimeloyl-ACP methyl ester carboxylesterase